MPTSSLTQPASKTIPPARAILRRFAWKEYRTLRAFWLAVLIVGLAIQWLSGVFLPPQTDWPALRLYVALAAATLYAAGAAAILFAIEHEDGTYDFLSGLPTTWLPLFVGKLLLATASAIALAAALTLTGLLPGGFKLASAYNASLAFGIFGVAIFEAIAWGTLFSLLFKRPLAAAIMTLIIGALATHVAVNLSAANNSSTASTDPQAYINAIPLRLTILVAVLACCVLAARRWLAVTHTRVARPEPPAMGVAGTIATTPIEDSGRATLNQLSPWLASVVLSLRERKFITRSVMTTLNPATTNVALHTNRGRRTTMLARLLWQSWRESWKLLPVPLLVAGLLLLGISAVLSLAASADVAATVIAATTFFAPALYGALAFSADQRRGQVRFLAEHAAAPRYVWLARHIVWLGTLVLLLILVAIALAIFLLLGVRDRSLGNLSYDSWYFESRGLLVLQDFVQAATNFATGSALACFGSLTAYTIGQFCSMLLRSEILAAFLALVLAVLLSAWIAVLFVWDLSGWLFLLPLAAGLMLATWLRAPAWIAGRNTWRAWVLPAIACVAPLVLIGLLLPQQRLAQVWKAYLSSQARFGTGVASPESSAAMKRLNAEAEETAQMYLKAAEMLYTPLEDDPLAPWSGPEYAGSTADGLPGGIDEFKIPRDQTNAYAVAKQKQIELWNEQQAAAIKLAIEASQRQRCQFKFNLSPNNRRNNLRLEPDKTYEALDDLLVTLTSPTIFGDVTLEQLLAGLRMSAHLRNGQPTTIFIRQLRREQEILQRIGEWAAGEERTNDQRREAIEKLQAVFDSRFRLGPDSALWADRSLIRNVIAGKELPLVLAEQPVSTTTYLAYLANELPWERERALQALNIISDHNVYESDELTNWLRRPTPHDQGNQTVRRWLQPGSYYRGVEWMNQVQAAMTSYLLRFEYDARVPIHELFREYLDTKTWQQAVLIEIALAMYREDHGEYPATLAALAPDYLDSEPLDPYSQQPFHYAPAGLDAPLVRIGYSRDDGIKAGTPLFWSAGPNDAQLIRRVEEIVDRNDSQPDAEPVARTDTVYWLYNHAYWSYGDQTKLVFPLPK